jgi:cyclophilin family peptidyl-prolyl cis-trans isomerase
MMRRLPITILACLALSLSAAACGDDEDNVSEGGGTETAATAGTETSPAEPASGCRKVDDPKPKKVKVDKPKDQLDAKKTWVAIVNTSCGTVEITLDVKENPKTASSFAHLVEERFFDGLSFHRIVPGFVVQGGDPENSGQGGPGYSVVEAPPQNAKYTKGVVAMAKTEIEKPGTSGSQFFIVTAEDAGLPPDYAIAGKVTKGEDVVDLLSNVPNDPADNRPTEPVVIENATLESR